MHCAGKSQAGTVYVYICLTPGHMLCLCPCASVASLSALLQRLSHEHIHTAKTYACKTTCHCAVVRMCRSLTHTRLCILHSHATITSSLAAQQDTSNTTTKAFTDCFLQTQAHGFGAHLLFVGGGNLQQPVLHIRRENVGPEV